MKNKEETLKDENPFTWADVFRDRVEVRESSEKEKCEKIGW